MNSSIMPLLKHGFSLNVKRSLIESRRAREQTKAMLNTEHQDVDLALAARLKEVLAPRGMKARVARACGINQQATNGWINTGKIDRNNLAVVATETETSLDWLLTGRGRKRAVLLAEDIAANALEDHGWEVSFSKEILIDGPDNSKITPDFIAEKDGIRRLVIVTMSGGPFFGLCADLSRTRDDLVVIPSQDAKNAGFYIEHSFQKNLSDDVCNSMDDNGQTKSEATVSPLAIIQRLQGKVSPRSREILLKLQKLAQEGKLTDEDWTLLDHIAQRFEQKNST